MKPHFLFDLDGTLVNSEPAHFEAHCRVWRRLGINLRLEEYISDGVSKNIRDFYQKIAARYCINANLPAAAEQKEIEFLNLIEGIHLMDGIRDLLEVIASHEHKMAVVTAGNSTYAREVLTQNHIYDQFAAIICGEELEMNKPHPWPYNVAMQRLGAEAQECIAFEDSDSGMLAAKRAGIFCVGLRHGFSKDQTGNDANLIIPSITSETYFIIRDAYHQYGKP